MNCCHGNQLMEECLAENMTKEANFLNIFFQFKSDDAETW